MTDTFDDQDQDRNHNNRPSDKYRILLWVALAMPIVIPLFANYKDILGAKIFTLLASLLPSVTRFLYTPHTYIF